MINFLIYIFITFGILKGLTRNLAKYVFLIPYLIYAAYPILDLIPDHGGMTEYSNVKPIISETAFYIQSGTVLVYLFISSVFDPKRKYVSRTSERFLLTKASQLGSLVPWSKLVYSLSLAATIFLVYYLPRHLASLYSLDYNVVGTEMRNIPYVSFILSLNNAIYFLMYCTQECRSKKKASLLFFMTVPCVILSIIGIRLFIFNILLLIFVTEISSAMKSLKKMTLLLSKGFLSKKATLTIVSYLAFLSLFVGYLSYVFIQRVGSEWGTGVARILFQETVYANISFFRAIQIGGRETIENFFQCSLALAKDGSYSCDIVGALGISTLWAEIFSYEDKFALLLILVILFYFLYTVLTFTSRSNPWIFIILLSSIYSGILNFWRSSILSGLLTGGKSLMALTVIVIAFQLFSQSYKSKGKGKHINLM